MVAFLVFGLMSFDKGRIRASWAKNLFRIIAAVGIASGLLRVALDFGLIFTSEHMQRVILLLLSATNGLLLGLILALIVSGQLAGTKRV
jgi:hypothetical protein